MLFVSTLHLLRFLNAAVQLYFVLSVEDAGRFACVQIIEIFSQIKLNYLQTK